MPEAIYKLQPDRTVHLRGFDHLGASAAIHSATPEGFVVTGQFRDASDFAVVMLYDADNFFEHPRLKYLPDFNFEGLRLTFDVSCRGLTPLNSTKYATIDWPYLDVLSPAGATTRIRLSDYAAVVAYPDLPASASFDIVAADLEQWDRLTLWYQNMAFDYIVPGKVRAEFAFFAGQVTAVHSITIRDRAYTHIEKDGDSSAMVAADLIAKINGAVEGIEADPEVSASQGTDPWVVKLTTKLDTGDSVLVGASGNMAGTLYHVQASTACHALRDQINGADYGAAKMPCSLRAESAGSRLTISTVQGGDDANFISMYAVAKNERLRTLKTQAKFSGGEWRATLRVSLDFADLGIPQIRQMWLTLAPKLADGEDYRGEEWAAVFTNWTVTGPEEVCRLKVAAPGSVRVGSLDGRCDYQGFWTMETGFFQDNAARVAHMAGSSVTLRYQCAQAHDLWLGTSLYEDRGPVRVELDGAAVGDVSTMLSLPNAAATRVKVKSGIPPGEHMVKLTTLDDRPFYFDFLEGVVEGDVPDALPAQQFEAPALDYSTDHTYKLPPARILWILEKLGYTGPLNEYIGVFWWNERRREGGYLPEAGVSFSGGFAAGDQVFIKIGGQTCGKTVFPSENGEIIAKHFAYLINATYVGVWAHSEGETVLIRARSASKAYSFPVECSMTKAAGSTGEVAGGGVLNGGAMGEWVIDEAAERTINAGARAWHEDFYRLCAARGRQVTTAVSMELVNPPAGFAAQYPDGEVVVTDTGFGGLRSTHCAFSTATLNYQKRVFAEIAGMMAECGLTPSLQCGEFTWWYFSNFSESNSGGGMGYFDGETRAAAQAALGRPLHVFTGPSDDPGVNGGADARFLRSRLRNYAAELMAHVRGSYPETRFEVLFPYDVNHPEPAGIHQLGGRLNRFVNLPEEWGSKVASGFDRFRVEALDYSAWSRDLELARSCLGFPMELGWNPESVRAMIPVFRGGYPWSKEVEYAKDLGMDSVGLWAFDHICLYGYHVGERGTGRAFRVG